MLEVEVKEKIDVELYEDFLNGNNEAFNKIAIKYQNQLINFINGYVKNTDIAEDLAQDTFLYVLVNKKEYDFKYTLKTYLYTIAKCRAINYLKKEKKKIEFNQDELYQIEEIDFDADIVKSKNIEIIRENIQNLKYEYKLVIYLRDFQDFQYKDICKILNKNMYQVKVLIHRARKALKKQIEKGGYKYDDWK